MVVGAAHLYRPAGGAMLRAAAVPLDRELRWPDLADPDSCGAWLRTVWAAPGFADAARYASVSFARQVDAVVAGQTVDPKRVHRATLAAMRYLLRTVGRPTPFGLFAGVAPALVAAEARVVWGDQHRALIRADTLWLDDLIGHLEASPNLLARLHVVASDLVTDRGERIEIPHGPGRVSVRNTAVVRLIRNVASAPITVATLAEKIAGQFPRVTAETIHQLVTTLVSHGVLITSLRAPMTDTDPLRHLIEMLTLCTDGLDEVAEVVTQLRAIQHGLARHNDPATSTVDQVSHRAGLVDRMRRLSSAGRTPLAGDLYLDCQVSVPAGLADEMAAAAAALVRLTREPRPDGSWDDWCREFWERYGSEAIVPVAEAIHPDAGIGLPAGFPASRYDEPKIAALVTRRDQELLRLAWETLAVGHTELVLTDELITAITAEEPVDERYAPPHLELGAWVRASSTAALSDGDYLFTVHPAWSFGTLTSRFAAAVPGSGFPAVWAQTPAGVDSALSVQLSFPPLFPHSENVSRIPAHLSYVLPLGEHRADDPSLIRLDDLGIVAATDGLHLVSISRRRVIEPQVLHALALPKQAPPLARFLAMLSRGFRARLTTFGWGPQAALLPRLPRVRYGRAILSPATWRITAAEYTAMATQPSWEDAVARWRDRWQCPPTVELYGEDRSLRLALTVAAHRALLREHLDQHGNAILIETETAGDTAWIGGRVHEIVMPFTRNRPPAPNRGGHRLPARGDQHEHDPHSRLTGRAVAVRASVHRPGPHRRNPAHHPGPARRTGRSDVLVRPLPQRP